MQRLQGSIRVDEEVEGARGKRRQEPFLWFMPQGIGLSWPAGLGLASVGATLRCVALGYIGWGYSVSALEGKSLIKEVGRLPDRQVVYYTLEPLISGFIFHRFNYSWSTLVQKYYVENSINKQFIIFKLHAILRVKSHVVPLGHQSRSGQTLHHNIMPMLFTSLPLIM